VSADSGTDGFALRTGLGQNRLDMKLTSLEAIVEVLHGASVRYLVVGGLAVNAHGYLRFTKDVDIVIQLVPDNIARALGALATLGYRPLVPITAEQFAELGNRERWMREKNMQVLQLWSDLHRETPIDVFVYEPFPFDQEYARAMVKPLSEEREVRFVTIQTLIDMKLLADRAQDRIDIENLRMRLVE